GGPAAGPRARLRGRRRRRRPAEPGRPPERVPVPPALPDRAGAALLDGGPAARARARTPRPQRRVPLRLARATAAAHPRDPPGGNVIERRTIVFPHDRLAGVGHPAFDARGA